MKRGPQPRKIPNILVTGSIGTGKSTLCQMLCEKYNKLKHYNISQIAMDNMFVEGKDEARDTYIIDDDKICDYLEFKGVDQKGDAGGHIVDYHSCAYFAERYFDLVIVVRAKIEVLNKRLTKRKYSKGKIKENLECEIHQVCLDEAKESYDNKIIFTMDNNSPQDMENIIKQILMNVKKWESCH